MIGFVEVSCRLDYIGPSLVLKRWLICAWHQRVKLAEELRSSYHKSIAIAISSEPFRVPTGFSRFLTALLRLLEFRRRDLSHRPPCWWRDLSPRVKNQLKSWKKIEHLAIMTVTCEACDRLSRDKLWERMG